MLGWALFFSHVIALLLGFFGVCLMSFSISLLDRFRISGGSIFMVFTYSSTRHLSKEFSANTLDLQCFDTFSELCCNFIAELPQCI